jgi:hypothetical protein
MVMHGPSRAGADFLPMGWSEVSEMLDRGSRRDAHYQAARWALDTLREQLGDHWLERATKLSDRETPLGLHLLGIHTLALAEALEWALRLEIRQRWDGSADFIRDLVQNPTPGRILHSRSQLAQGCFAECLGWPVVLEPKRKPGAPADLEVTAPSGPMVIEIRVLSPSKSGLEQHAVAENASNWLFELRLVHDVWIGGELGRDPDEGERLEIEEFVRREAPSAQAGVQPRYSSPDISLVLAQPGSDAPALTSPPVREDLFTRMVRAITAKAKRMEISDAQWLHVTVLTGLWAFTPWGRDPLANKAPVMSAALSEALGDRRPDGIVMTSAASLAPENMEEEIAKDSAGIALRSAVSPLRGRESLILPLTKQGEAESEQWLALVRSESDWLPRALVERGLPSLDEILRLPTS